MKANYRNFVYASFNTLLLAVVIGILVVIAAKAQGNVDFDVVNGLFTPTQSERFFQAGREDFEREIKIFNHPEWYLGDDLLQIDPELIEQMNLEIQTPDFKVKDSQYKFYQDTK